MRTKLIALGGAALIATLPFATETASAAAPACRAGSVCTWSQNDFHGTKRTSGLNPSPGCYPWGGKTVSNQTKRTIRVYSDVSCYGKHVDIKSKHWGQTKPGATIKSIAVLGP
ncbi:peptidase inhibitor family I36 protein [Streptomyces sp. NPDC005408]|uniref:peptidase inhibitor family I36 protein n=1 Tax=Streptomyces sp. NPDC005408 TaxID=3155341 RepID=UPI0033AE48E2